MNQQRGRQMIPRTKRKNDETCQININVSASADMKISIENMDRVSLRSTKETGNYIE